MRGASQIKKEIHRDGDAEEEEKAGGRARGHKKRRPLAFILGKETEAGRKEKPSFLRKEKSPL